MAGALGGGLGGPRQGIDRAEFLAFAQALRATAGRELGFITDSTDTLSRAGGGWRKGAGSREPASTSGAKFGNRLLGETVELIKVENHVDLEKAEWRGLCRGTLACNVGADKVTGKAALRVQAGAGIAGEIREMEQDAVQRPRGPTSPSQAVQRERVRGAGSIPPVGRSGNLPY